MSQVENVLRLEHVTMQFGGVVAVNDLSLEVNQGEIVALIHWEYRPHRPDRPQWRRQDHCLQLHHRSV